MPLPIHDVTQGALLERLAEEIGEREALVYPHRGLRLSFRALDARADALARGLIALGVEPGERVTLWADNRPDWVPLQFALAKIGAILVTANTALQRDEVAYLLRQSRSSVVIAAPGVQSTEYFDALTSLRSEEDALPELRHAVALEGEPPAGFLTLPALVRNGEGVPLDDVRARTAATRVGDPTNIQYTSGTTGFPKGVVLTHENIVENGYAVARRFGAGPEDRLLLQVPLFHCFGCVISVLGSFTHGVPLVVLERFHPLKALEAIEGERCTLIHGVPTMFRAILEHEDFGRFDLSSLRAGAMGGSTCPEELMRRVIDRMGCNGVVNAYGLTECSPAISLSSPDDSIEHRVGTAGQPLDGVEVRVVDPATDAEVPAGERGELWARGPNVMLGYYEHPEATAEAVTPDGWLRTGDLATIGEDGRVRIVGRIKDMIIRGGENVYPAEVEDALRAHEAVQDAAVFGVPSEAWGEEVAAAIVLHPDAPNAAATAEELDAFLTERLAHFKRPAHVHFVDAFPMTPSGKVQKFLLQERFGPS
ncbi:MAG: AMP-binding protein [Planctomycetota bacterium]|nr:AMP-binding protein [Planctomycetota bacterium]